MLELKNVTYRYDRKCDAALKGADLVLPDGEVGILMGKNGSGKTTLFKTVLGICKPSAGEIYFNGKDLRRLSGKERARLIAYVPQDIRFGSLTVFDSVLAGRVSRFGIRAGKEDILAVEKILAEMELENVAHRFAEELSGGERQKTAIARALAQEPELLIFDEPTGNLDIANERLILNEAKKMSKKGISVLCSIHDPDRALEFGDRFFFIRGGTVRHSGGRECFTPETIKEIFDVDVKIVNVEGKSIVVY